MKVVRAFTAALLLLGLATFANTQAGPSKTAPVRQGQYSCVFAFGGTFFDTKPVTIREGNQYEASSGKGTWKYNPARKQINFLNGPFGRDFSTALYVPAGFVAGGLKNRKGPAIVLKPSASYKKRKGPEAVSQYCYLQTSPK